MIDADLGPRVQEVIQDVALLARISPATYQGENFYGFVQDAFAKVYEGLFSKTTDGQDIITTPRLKAIAKGEYLANHFDQMLDAVAWVRFPGTKIPMFERGGSYALLRDGILTDCVDERKGLVYEVALNEGPYLILKPSVFDFLNALGRERDIGDQHNTNLISATLRDRLGEKPVIHKGGVVAYLPVVPGGEK